MKRTLGERTEPDLIPADTILTVKVESIEPREWSSATGPIHKLSFKFLILDLPREAGVEWIGRTVYGSVFDRFEDHPDNELKQWVEALLGGIEITSGFELDTDQLIGRKARAVIEHYPRKVGGTGQSVGALLPIASAAPLASPAPQPLPPPKPAAPVYAQQGLGDDVPF